MKYLAIIIFFGLIGCRSVTTAVDRTTYVSEFKLAYFKTLLKKAYNDSDHINSILQNDTSSFTEPILTDQSISLIQTLTKIDNAILVKDSINSYARKAEGAEGKATIRYALDKFKSKWLDSIARNQYKIYFKQQSNFKKQIHN